MGLQGGVPRGGPICPPLSSQLAQQVQTWPEPPWAAARGWSSWQGSPWRHSLSLGSANSWLVAAVATQTVSAELTDMWTLVADLRGEGHVVSPPPVPRVSLLRGCREVLRGTAPCVTWVGAQT